MLQLMSISARVALRLDIPFRFYLQEQCVFGTEWTRKQFTRDPLGRTSYPLAFLASLFAADMCAVSSEQITCPLVVIVSMGDPLFPFDYIQRVYERIQAPSKELLVFELNAHLIFNECLEEVLPRLVDKLKHYSLYDIQITP
jgi:pimeloyl-ACP methyl ester carboxylesterase